MINTQRKDADIGNNFLWSKFLSLFPEVICIKTVLPNTTWFHYCIITLDCHQDLDW